MSYHDDVLSRDVTYLASKDVLTNKEQLYQLKAFGNRSMNINLKRKYLRGEPPPLSICLSERLLGLN